MRVLIADPDAESRRVLRALLSVAPDVTVAAECDDGLQIPAACTDNNVGLVFLDSSTSHMAEFYTAHAALPPEARAQIVGLAEDETSAVHALEQGAMDFILKPATERAITRVLIKSRHLRSSHRSSSRHGGFLHAAELSQVLRSAVEHLFGQEQGYGFGKLAVKVGTHVRLLKLMNIMYARAAGDYVDITLSTGERIHTKDQLTSMMTRLPSPQFLRAHRSFILNREYVKEIRSKNNDYEMVLTDDTIITSGSTYRKQVRQQFLLNAVS